MLIYFLIFPTLIHSYMSFFFSFIILSFSFLLSAFLPLFLTLLNLPETYVTCQPIDGFQASEDSKHTAGTKTDPLPRGPGGISGRVFFISNYWTWFTRSGFSSGLHTVRRLQKKENKPGVQTKRRKFITGKGEGDWPWEEPVPPLLPGPSYTPWMGNWFPEAGGRLVDLSPAAGLWWPRNLGKAGGVWCPVVGGSHGLGKASTSGENRMLLEQVLGPEGRQKEPL